ncbi:prolyl oligopeptidase family serine peptidase [Dyella sp. ASV21]|jgi:acetyl esterase/lipase|uniref:alpha/beta hydrolase family protein n=1 Tax=Dyella sp. ASV21 TaxID=2795114 RepID=UPI0018EC5C9D|nr:prolyl oligopeptidase family serine peptidase [Dyella sp. ASV21]
MKRTLKRCLHMAAGFGLAWALPAWAGTVSFEDLAKHMQYNEVKISGDGHYLAATVVVKDKPMLALIDLSTEKGVMVTPREGNQVVNFWWANNKRVLYTEGTKVSGWDRPFATGEIFGVNADGTGAALLFGYRAGGTSNSATMIKKVTSERASASLVSTLPNDDNHVLIGVDPWDEGSDGAFTTAYLMDVRDGSKRPVGKAPLRNAELLADHHGEVRFAMGLASQGHSQVFYREGDGKPWKQISLGSLEHGAEWPLAFNRDDSVVYMTCGAPGKVAALCPWDVATQTLKAPVWSSATSDIEGLVHSLDHLDVVGVYTAPGMPAVEPIMAGADTTKVIATLSKALPGESVRVVSSTLSGDKAVALASSDMDPGEFYLWDNATGKATFLFKRASWIKPDLMASMQPVEFKARDGLTVHAYLSMPPGREEAKHLPLVMFIHGGPFGIRDYWQFDPYVQMMATRGYAVLQVNYRGSGGYGYGFERAGYRQWGGKMQDDVTDATHWAIAQGIADPGRICIFGASYGGYAALEGAVKEPDLYRCAIGYVGVYDLSLMYKNGDASNVVSAKNYLRLRLGDNEQELAAHSPINQLDSLKANVMLVVGGQDTRVPPEHGQKLHAALQSRGIAHEWLYKSDEAHGFYNEKNTVELFERINQFLDRNIGGASSAVGSH